MGPGGHGAAGAAGARPDLSGWPLHPWIGAGQGRVRIGVGVTALAASPAWATCLRLVQALDALDVDSFWQPDHPSLAADCWLTLGAVATHTRRLRLGPLVSCVGYRPPALLARHAADVDRLSGGRLVLGLGAGWLEGEYRALGLPFPALRDRLRGLEETVAVVPGLWATEGASRDTCKTRN